MSRHEHPGRLGGVWGHLGRLIQLEGEGEETSFSFSPGTLHPDFAAHGFYQLLANIQPQPGTAHGAIHITLKPHKTLKEALLVFWRYARAIIADRQRTQGIARTRRYVNWGANRRIFKGVPYQV